MLKSLTILLAFQALGELLSFALFPSIPGPVLGLIALLVFFFIHGGVPTDIQSTANVFTSNLGLLFVPAAVGVVVGGVLVVVSQYAFEKYYSNAEQYLCLDCQQAFAWVP